jgi:hypothetical protein
MQSACKMDLSGLAFLCRVCSICSNIPRAHPASSGRLPRTRALQHGVEQDVDGEQSAVVAEIVTAAESTLGP